ncbi:MAG: 4Fe-4S dicluster domain-containing protein [Candidatus Woesearchaeota archaeon]|nr:MAG: 4Fe-4S dicluster domain-containing protein [Candidatus Woesearchaeota archaeon]
MEKVLKKKALGAFLKKLASFGQVYGPVKTDTVRFEPVSHEKQLCLDEHAWFPVKEFLFPQKQVFFRFDGEKIITEDNVKKAVLFGLRKCDLNAFLINDKLFLEGEHKDLFYEQRRNNLLLVGLYCYHELDEFCFCSSMNLQDYHDIMLYDRGSYYQVKAGTPKGEFFIAHLKDTEAFVPPPTTCSLALPTQEIAHLFEHQAWKEGADSCTSCGHCTNLCPTCLCFTISDDVALDGKGERVAEWDSCQYKEFTEVAGGHVFREKRVDRFKHRIYHKIQYFRERFDMSMCTGCGRCIRGCPEKIHWIHLIGKMTQ